MKNILLIVISLTGFINLYAQTPLGTEMTYQGQLKDNNGNLLTGQFDFKFLAFDSPNDGSGSNLASLTIEDVELTNGIFT